MLSFRSANIIFKLLRVLIVDMVDKKVIETPAKVSASVLSLFLNLYDIPNILIALTIIYTYVYTPIYTHTYTYCIDQCIGSFSEQSDGAARQCATC